MHLTTKGKYAVTAMLDMALQDPDKFVTIYQVANRQSIPAPYLEQLFRYLRKADILSSHRGPNGGFKLSKSSKDIKIGEIISAVEKRMDATQCSGEANCSSGSKCLAHNLWTDLNDQVQSFLMDKSLEDVLNGKKFLSKPNKNTENSLLIATG